MRQQRKINNFYVLYRISDNGNKNKNKLECATKINCLKNALEVFKQAKIIVYIDNVIESTDKEIHKLCDNLNNVSIKYLECRNNSKSFRAAYEDALLFENDDFVYFLEDDYLHLKNSFNVLKYAAEFNYTDYITLYDHPDKYDYGCVDINPYCKNFGEQTTVFRTSNHHWKITNSTTMTFGAFVDVLKRDKDVFWENTSTDIPKDFKIFLELRKNGILVSSPIPSLSTHCEKKYLATFINWANIPKMNNNCCVVIINHTETLSNDEKRSINKAFEVFGGKRDIFIVLPENIKTNEYEVYADKSKILKVNSEWLSTYKAYNKTLCSSDFYKLFIDYNYILIYQTDCWVFEDRLDYFMGLGYDWYGAAWPHEGDAVGNGGFSLRKISKMLELTNKYSNDNGINEDLWFCKVHKNELNICDLETTCNFSIEVPTNKYLSLLKSLPMGLHGKIMKNYWDNFNFIKK